MAVAAKEHALLCFLSQRFSVPKQFVTDVETLVIRINVMKFQCVDTFVISADFTFPSFQVQQITLVSLTGIVHVHHAAFLAPWRSVLLHEMLGKSVPRAFLHDRFKRSLHG
jgi:hypothetical protein